jgi:hypothetical protein
MMFRTFFVALLACSALAVAAGCSGDSTDPSPSGDDTGTKKGGKTDTGKTGTGGTDQPSPTKDTTPTEPKKKSYGSQCKDSSECESDFCVFQGGSIGMCTKSCEDNIDCPGLGQKCVKVADAPQKVCVPE